eukprot:g3648.t1
MASLSSPARARKQRPGKAQSVSRGSTDKRGGGRHRNEGQRNNHRDRRNGDSNRKNRKNSRRNPYYEPHMEPDNVKIGLSAGKLLSGKLRVNTKKREQSFVTVQGIPCDIFIANDKFRNRALDGDVVALRLMSTADWKGTSVPENTPDRGASSSSGNNNDESLTLEHAAKEVNLLWRPIIPHGWSSDASSDVAIADDSEAKSSLHEAVLEANGPAWRQVREGVAAGLQPQAEVVCILDRKSPSNIICVMDTFCEAARLHRGKPLPTSENFVRLRPVDNRFPYMLLPRHKAPKDFIADPLGAPSRLKLFVARPLVEGWSENSRFTKCTIVRQLGEAGEISAETEALLMQHGFARRGVDGDFDQDVLDCLEGFRISDSAHGKSPAGVGTVEMDGDDPRTGWTIPEEEIAKRRDLRGYRIFSIDPATAKDLDDALHVTQLPDGRIELGVHIADVSYYVKPGNALDLEASMRATTVYLVQKSLPMLPRLLSENLCSLNPNEDRLAYSCIWYMDRTGNLTKDPPWYGRTVIRSCCKLDYGLAQAMIEGEVDASDGEDVSKNAKWPVNRRPTGGHAPADVINDVQLMNAIAKQRRMRRYESGALALQGVKLCFRCDKETGNPIDTFTYPIKDSNRLVEEYMLLANYLVAQKLILGAKKLAAIRRHPEPHPKKLQEYAQQCKERGFDIDVTSAGRLHSSLLRLGKHEDPIAQYALTTLATVPMKPAVYFAAGTENQELWRHYALNIPYYTHFTSPIRRYADVMVHRLLTAVLQDEIEDFYEDQRGIHAVLEHCNEKKLASKAAQERGDEVYFCVFLKSQKREAEAVVMDWGDSSFELFVPLYGVTKRVHVDDLRCELRKRNIGFSLHPIVTSEEADTRPDASKDGEGGSTKSTQKGPRVGAASGAHSFSGCCMKPGVIPSGGVHVKMLTRMNVLLYALDKIPIDFALEVKSVPVSVMEDFEKRWKKIKSLKKDGLVTIETSLGAMLFQLYFSQAPIACDNFAEHCSKSYFVGTSFHRLIPGFMVQGGDPTGTGRGGESAFTSEGGTKTFRDEFSDLRHDGRGVLAMANSGPDTNASQFYITFGPSPHLDGKHTIFGQMISGAEVLDRIEKVPLVSGTERPRTEISIISTSVDERPVPLNNEKKTKPPDLVMNNKKSASFIASEKMSNTELGAASSVGTLLRVSTRGGDHKKRKKPNLLRSSASAKKGKTKKFGDFSGW